MGGIWLVCGARLASSTSIWLGGNSYSSLARKAYAGWDGRGIGYPYASGRWGFGVGTVVALFMLARLVLVVGCGWLAIDAGSR